MTVNQMLNDKAETLVHVERGEDSAEYTVQFLYDNGFGDRELMNEGGPILKIEADEFFNLSL